MRGARASLPPRKTKVNLVVTAARYEDAAGELTMAKAYEPWGHVWSDVQLFSREQLVERLRAGEIIAHGRTVDLATDFEVEGILQLEGVGDEIIILAQGRSGDRDDLGVPRF